MKIPNNNITAVYNAIIIGAGGAGMCLLYAMYETGYLSENKVLVIEPNKKESNNRTWCYWAKPSENITFHLSPIANANWQWLMHNKEIKPLSPFSYFHLRSLDFYNFVYDKINACSNVSWHYVAANSVEQIDEKNYEVLTKDGYTFQGRYIFDSRINPQKLDIINNQKDVLWQSFFGYRILLNEQTISEKPITMMDFSIEQNGFCQFVYVLPFSDKEALIEFTRFGNQCLDSSNDDHILKEWIKTKFGAYTIIEEEEGKIPMSILLYPDRPFHHSNDRHIFIGTAAGSLKSTTGYAFKSMFNHSFAIMDAMKSKKLIPTEFHSERFTFYDKLLIWLLSHKPHLGKMIFTNLFNKIKPGIILKFLEEKTSISEEIPLVSALPKRHFILALFQRSFTTKK